MKKIFLILILLIPLISAEEFVYLKMNGNQLGETVSYEVEIGKNYFFEGKGDSGLNEVIMYINGENNLQRGINPKITWSPKEEKIYEMDIIGRKNEEIITSQKFYLTAKQNVENTVRQIMPAELPSSEEFFSKCDLIKKSQSTEIFDLKAYNIKIGFADENINLPKTYYAKGMNDGDFAIIFDDVNKIVSVYFYKTEDKDYKKSIIREYYFAFLNDPCSGFWNILLELKDRKEI